MRRVPTVMSRAGLLAVAVLCLGACDSSRTYDFRIEFDDPATSAAAELVVARIRAGGCAGPVLVERTFRRASAPAMDVDVLPAGDYAFEGVARDASCLVVASACMGLQVPDDESPVVLTLLAQASPTPGCPPASCDRGACPGEGMRSDAGVDASTPPGPDAGPTIEAPSVISPWNGVATGSANAVIGDGEPADHPLRPEVRWNAVGGALSYALEMVPCSQQDLSRCDFSAPPVRVITDERTLRVRPASHLAVSDTAPMGRRYAFRVGACSETAGRGCSYSAPRYLDVGRVFQDVDGDGYGDLFVILENDDTTTELRRITGFEAGEIETVALSLGTMRTISWIGDYDGDGVGELAVATQRGGSGSEVVYVDDLAEAGAIVEPSGVDLGRRMAGVGDVDGDGYDDFAVSVPSRGEVRIQYGGPTFNALDNDVIPAGGLDAFGYDLAGVGDQDGDGLADVAIGGRLTMDTARFLLFSMAGSTPRMIEAIDVTTGETSPGPTIPPLAIGGAVDMDDDGRPDIGFGQPELDSLTVEFADRRESAVESGGGRFGAAVASGDLDGTGRGRFVVGGPNRPGLSGTISGGTYVVSYTGSPFLTIFQQYLTPDDERIGTEVTVVDLNGDGLDDFFCRGGGGFVIDRMRFDTMVGGIRGNRFLFAPSGTSWKTMSR